MIHEKTFHNLDEQIEKLIGRGLVITDKDNAKNELLKMGYYDLINGYKDLFLLDHEEVEDEKYIKGTKFDDLITLYQLDRELRHIVMRVTLDLESNFYTTLAYCIAEVYGAKQSDYLIETNYRRGKRQARGGFERDNLFNRIRIKINDPYEHPMKYYKQKYENIPPWILAKHMNFGELIVWYKLSSSEIKNNVIQKFTGLIPDEKLKESFLKSMELFNKFRNRAAHGGRIYNYKSNIEIPFNEELHGVLYIEKDDHNKGVGRSNFSAFLLARMHLKENDKKECIEKFVYLNVALNEYKQKSPKYYKQVIAEMGLPLNYNDLIYKSIGLNYSSI